jgi:hypothetical protein
MGFLCGFWGERDCGVSVAKKSNPALERGGKKRRREKSVVSCPRLQYSGGCPTIDVRALHG